MFIVRFGFAGDHRWLDPTLVGPVGRRGRLRRGRRAAQDLTILRPGHRDSEATEESQKTDLDEDFLIFGSLGVSPNLR